MDDAMRSFEGVLAEKPTNIVALLGKVRSPTRLALLELTRLSRPAFFTQDAIILKLSNYSSRSSN